jgi:beta-lactamase family protein
MTRTHFHDDHTMIVKDRTSAYQPRRDGGLRVSIPVFDTYGATSLFTTVEDMAKWDQNFVDKKVGGETVMAQMLEPGVLNNGKKLTYAFGLAVGQYKGLKTVGHGGADAGYRSDFIRFPDQRLSLVCLCNFSRANPGMLTRSVADIYLADQLKPDPPKVKPVIAAVPTTGEKPTEQELASKVGSYYARQRGETIRLELKAGKLTANVGPGLELLPISKDRFQVLGEGIQVTFEGTSNGHPQRMLAFPEGEREPIAYEYVETAKPTPALLAEYAGDYYSEELDTRYTVILKDDKLVIRRKKLEDTALNSTFTDAFSNPDFGGLRFIRDSAKRVSGFEFSAGRVRNLQFSKESR